MTSSKTTDRKKIDRAIKTAQKETEKKISRKQLKSKRKKVARILKVGHEKIERLLKAHHTRVARKIRENNSRIADALRGIKRQPKKRIQRGTNAFDLRRWRGNRKKETFVQRLKRCADVHTVRDKILYGIADGKMLLYIPQGLDILAEIPQSQIQKGHT